MKDVPETIKNFCYWNPVAISFDLTEVYDEQGVKFFNPSIMIHLDVEEEEDGWATKEAVVLQTAIASEDANTALKEAVTLSSQLFDADVISSGVIYDTDGNEIDRFDMNSVLATTEVNSPVSKSYDLANMPVGVPLIKH